MVVLTRVERGIEALSLDFDHNASCMYGASVAPEHVIIRSNYLVPHSVYNYYTQFLLTTINST